jgi:hypothetical protein
MEYLRIQVTDEERLLLEETLSEKIETLRQQLYHCESRRAAEGLRRKETVLSQLLTEIHTLPTTRTIGRAAG